MSNQGVIQYFNGHTICKLLLIYIHDNPSCTSKNIFTWLSDIGIISKDNYKKEKTNVQQKLVWMTYNGVMMPHLYKSVYGNTHRKHTVRLYKLSSIGEGYYINHPEWINYYQDVVNKSIIPNSELW